jgi:hypothetical protein
MPTPAHAEWRAHVDHEIHRLRKQFIFLFAFGVAVSVLLAVGIQYNSAQADDQMRLDRYLSCLNRASEITAYNAKIMPPGVIPAFPVPKCPPDPRLD